MFSMSIHNWSIWGEKKKSITGQFLRLTKNNDLKQMSNIKQGKIIIMMNGLRSAQNANVWRLVAMSHIVG